MDQLLVLLHHMVLNLMQLNIELYAPIISGITTPDGAEFDVFKHEFNGPIIGGITQLNVSQGLFLYIIICVFISLFILCVPFTNTDKDKWTM